MRSYYLETQDTDVPLVDLPGDQYEANSPDVVDYDEFMEREGIDFFPLFETKDDVFREIPSFVWENHFARLLLQQLAIVYETNKNPSISYTPIRVEQAESFFVLEWVFQDKRVAFFFSENEDNKYSFLFYNADEKSFVNTVKVLSPERYSEVAEEVISFIS